MGSDSTCSLANRLLTRSAKLTCPANSITNMAAHNSLVDAVRTEAMNSARQSGDMKADTLEPTQFSDLLRERIGRLDVDSAREDVVRFIREPDQLRIWSRDYFLQLSAMVRFA